MKFILIAFAGLFALSACSRNEEAGNADTVLMTKYNEPFATVPHQAVMDTVAVDSAAIHRHQDEMKLARFTPKEVVVIYDGYRPLRKRGTSEAQIEAFLRQRKITREELRVILAEGDRLGWAK
jgi:hypothetical protein